jgi:hypothetical protein
MSREVDLGEYGMASGKHAKQDRFSEIIFGPLRAVPK